MLRTDENHFLNIPAHRWSNARGYVVWFMINIITSVLHYVHNIVYFEDYPEPVWINTTLVDMFWFVMTPVGIFGLYWELLQHHTKSYVATVLYCVMSMITIGHYFVESDKAVTMAMHFYIWIEVLSALMFLGYATARHLGRKQNVVHRDMDL